MKGQFPQHDKWFMYEDSNFFDWGRCVNLFCGVV
jgi:hypothetical protein